MSLRVLTWNLMHGRAVPPAGRDLLADFAGALDGWEWDVALLQEVPPWWPDELGARLGAETTRVLTSRNLGLALRRALAVRWPDAMRANGGGSNAILVRGPAIAERRTLRLALVPERRWLLAVRIASAGGVWVGNVHANGWPPRAAANETQRAADAIRAWAGPPPIVLGGDFNLESPALDGYARVAGHNVDFVFVRGLEAAGPVSVLDRGPLSDHAPVAVTLRPAAPPDPERAPRSPAAP